MKRKRLLFSVLFSFIASLLAAQTVYTEPRFITTDWNSSTETFYVYYDATQGNGAMVGATSCYAHTGVITSLSEDDSDWRHAPTWLDNDAKYQLEKVDGSTDLWRLKITGGLAAYYELLEGETVEKMTFVFRDATASAEGKEADGGDIYYTLYEPGLNVVITEPADGTMLQDTGQAQTITVKGEASESADLKLEITTPDGTTSQIATVSSATSIDGQISVNAPGNYTIKLTATEGQETAVEEISLFVEKETVKQAMPEGMKEGINYDPATQTVGLAFRAPRSESVIVLGDFNNWELSNDYKMNCHEYELTNPDGTTDTNRIFWLQFRLDDTTKYYAFQYLVDGTDRVDDPYATMVLDPWNDQYISNIIDPNLPDYPEKGDGLVSVLQVVDLDPYQWSDATLNFQMPAKEDLIIYELHIRDFCNDSKTGMGSLDCLMDKLDYLEKLGVNAIELLPITEFDGNDSWGYNPNHFFAPDKAYGTRNQYKAFIDECHKRGMAVILDMVFNHATGIHPFAALYYDGSATTDENPWFNRVARHPYNVFHDFNHEYEGTRSYFKRVLEYWIQEYKVDGYRMDLTKGLTQNNTGENVSAWSRYDASRIAILKDYYDTVVATDQSAVFILEHLSDYQEEAELSEYGMLPWRNMNNSYSQAAMGYASESNFVDGNGKGGMYTDGWVGYAESHDEERNFYKAEAYGDGDLQSNEEARLARVPLVQAFVHFIPGPKMMWEFGEMGYDYSINHCSDGTESEECRTYRKPIPWTLGWDNDPLRMNAYENTAAIISLRTSHPEYFKDGNVTVQNCATSTWNADSPRRILVSYTDDANPDNSVEMIIIGNFSATENINPNITFPFTGIWYEYLTGEEYNIRRTNRQIPLEAGEVKILMNKNIQRPTGIDETTDASVNNIVVYPSPTENMVYVNSADYVQNISVFDLSGALVAQSADSDEISLGALGSGNYIIKVETESGSLVQKIIKK